MFYQQQNTKIYENAVKEAAGVDPAAPEKIALLQKKWRNEVYRDTEAAYVICPILFTKTKPIHTAIIADNINYFKNHYHEELAGNYEPALAEACLCGSRAIAEFLLSELNSSFATDHHSYLLAYVAASMNVEWAKDIARDMAQAKMTMPKTIYNIADYKTIDLIIAVFKNPNKPPEFPSVFPK